MKKRCKRTQASQATSRCAIVAKKESRATDVSLRRTEGVFSVVDMRIEEVLFFGEMLNCGRAAYKHQAADTVHSHVEIGTHCHGCACATKLRAKRCFLDSWHSLKHKCDKSLYDLKHNKNVRWMRGCDSEAAEHLQSRTDKFSAVLHPNGSRLVSNVSPPLLQVAQCLHSKQSLQE